MKSHQTSVGKKCLLLIVGLVVVSTLGGCTIKHIREEDDEADRVNKEEAAESGEVSLKGESDARQELRKDIPETVRVQNDERAVILQLMVEEKDSPEIIQMRFNTMMSRLRNDNRKANDKKREDFKRAEKTKRDAFVAEQKKARDEYTKNKSKKTPREETTQFYNDLEAKRKDFFAEEREKRNAFESEMRQQTNDFSSRMRDWQSEFNQEYRIYGQKWRAKGEAKKKERENALKLLNKPAN